MRHIVFTAFIVLYSCSNIKCSKNLYHLELENSKLNCECFQFVDYKYKSYEEYEPFDNDYSSHYEAIVTDSICQTKLLDFLRRESTWNIGPLDTIVLSYLDIPDRVLRTENYYYSLDYESFSEGEGGCYWYRITYYNLISNKIIHKEFSL